VRRRLFLWFAFAAALHAGSAAALAGDAAQALREQRVALAEELTHNQFHQPLHMQSNEEDGRLSGDVYAVIDHPFAQLSASLKRPSQWCDVMILVINIKRCEAADGSPAGSVALNVGRKYDQPLKDTYRIAFTHHLETDTPEYFQVRLNADHGPFGTTDYRIVLEAVASERGQTFLHLRYAYHNGFAARLAFLGYLSTLGRNKVGFTIVGHAPDGEPVYVRSVRGAIERTTMRYYLAITSYLNSLSAPPAEREERRMRSWFAATERYARQLHEVDEEQYLTLKRSEMKPVLVH
jgi:hypothetical protein